ncbi:hypothetical protein SCLCIDRAFT_1217856 [Scleroderma citrinum Foug A]|uniref:Uncharacterized protein n=1 Tax=Scleroderma citrinum Foug A TaxID=1036808 RepID=A0A0C3A3M3_9AGAM|nr:hypothetical protein SCLCIDRAFT_1217856 [Scleroderma citrinum Foug A]
MVDEAEHSLSDALSVLSQTVRDACIVLDGGCSEMLMSRAVDETARKAKGKKAIPMEAFAHALRQIPTIVTDNAGDDSSDLVTCLRAAQYKGQTAPAWRLERGTTGSMRKIGIMRVLSWNGRSCSVPARLQR